jgi:hypothetical protein
MTQIAKPSHLRLVNVDFSVACQQDLQPKREVDLEAEASSIEAACGANAYSTFLRKHGRRPDKDQAAAIGRLLGGQVRAADGSMQPPLSKADREAIKAIRQRRKDWAKSYSNFARLKLAINALAEIDEPTDELLRFCAQSEFATKSQLCAAITLIERFAEELSRHEQDARAAEEVPEILARRLRDALGSEKPGSNL